MKQYNRKKGLFVLQMLGQKCLFSVFTQFRSWDFCFEDYVMIKMHCKVQIQVNQMIQGRNISLTFGKIR